MFNKKMQKQRFISNASKIVSCFIISHNVLFFIQYPLHQVYTYNDARMNGNLGQINDLFNIIFKYSQMSITRIKDKITASFNPEKDLQSTTHSHRLNPCLPIFDSHLKNMRLNITQSHIQTIKSKENSHCHYQLYPQTSKDYDRIKCKSHGFRSSYSPSQISNNTDHTQRKSIETSAFDCGASSVHSTPRSKSKSKHAIERKIIENLCEADTVQSKFMMNTTPRQVLQQSQIVFKGSRDVGKIMPLKLTYQPEYQVKSIIVEIPQKIENQWDMGQISFELIKQSSADVKLGIVFPSSTLFSLVQLNNSYILDNMPHFNILRTFAKKKIQNMSYIFGQCYEYTLGQLISNKKIDHKGIQVIWKHLQPVVQLLCQQKYSFFQIEGVQNNIFYVHGVFKMLPIFRKGKVQVLKKYGVVKQQIINYLLDLVYNASN